MDNNGYRLLVREKGKLMDNEYLWRKLKKDYGVEKRWTNKETGIGLIAGIIYLIASGWLYFVTVMAR